ncbi:hypothetical protein [Granulicella arctica]|uniref:Uncharacterized protein n=1 Tax=Granulicella arctica TaxID=940613 RepID=A0A7Y9TGF6_9BACT|nr:hypothetical protein [Granulicella arctica]NYF79856.1 hypothetical protein [Granulicella arctica]
MATWIEQNILLDLGSVPFDKDDATLLSEAGSYTNCSKRTGCNTLLFGEALKDSCSDAACYNNKVARFVGQQIAVKPQLVQISTNWGPPKDNGAPGRGRYIALRLSPKSKGGKAPPSPNQKQCSHMKEATVTEGVERGLIGKVCCEPTCSGHCDVWIKMRCPRRSWSGFCLKT